MNRLVFPEFFEVLALLILVVSPAFAQDKLGQEGKDIPAIQEENIEEVQKDKQGKKENEKETKEEAIEMEEFVVTGTRTKKRLIEVPLRTELIKQ